MTLLPLRNVFQNATLANQNFWVTMSLVWLITVIVVVTIHIVDVTTEIVLTTILVC